MSEPVESGRSAHALEALRAVILSPLFIAFLTAVCVAVRALRTQADIGPHYAFVGFNLFLAWIPLGLAYGLSYSARSKLTWIALPPLAVLWIIFLPNAPYLVTDLVHLEEGVNVVNVLLLSLLAITGVLLRRKLLKLVQGAVERLFGPPAGGGASCGGDRGADGGRDLPRSRSALEQLDGHPSSRGDHGRRFRAESPRSAPADALALCVTVVCASGFLLAYRVLAGRDAIPTARAVRGGATRGPSVRRCKPHRPTRRASAQRRAQRNEYDARPPSLAFVSGLVATWWSSARAVVRVGVSSRTRSSTEPARGITSHASREASARGRSPYGSRVNQRGCRDKG